MELAGKPPARRINLAAIRAKTLVFCIAWTCCMAALVAYMSAVYVLDHGVEIKTCYAIRASYRVFHGPFRSLLFNSEDYLQGPEVRSEGA